ncbi:hypothetical protein BD626DRAFT_565350 [Schizophyllum amplum]|uniref:NADH-ubiquinone reductase complex 1 MLRQ subunit-domain-containing protein n=1 Tax=Schizophyllum amplum TaxID=97359 RepID=A0A550CUQ9_9AGAR|nr:hypothetical protein BD626DRAFT_565350 [Auriculariopsis ampla]
MTLLRDNMRRNFMRNWYAVEALPIWIIIGTVIGIGGLSIYRAVQAPSVTWTKANPTPWNRIKPDERVKLMEVNQKMGKKWSRDEL